MLKSGGVELTTRDYRNLEKASSSHGKKYVCIISLILPCWVVLRLRLAIRCLMVVLLKVIIIKESASADTVKRLG